MINSLPEYVSQEEIKIRALAIERDLRKLCAGYLKKYKVKGHNWELPDGTSVQMPTWLVPLDHAGSIVIKKIPPIHPLFPINPRYANEEALSELILFGTWGTRDHPLNDSENTWSVGDRDPSPWPVHEHFYNAKLRCYPEDDGTDDETIDWFYNSNLILQVPLYAAMEFRGSDTGDAKLSIGLSNSRPLCSHLSRIGWGYASLDSVKRFFSPIVVEQTEFGFSDVYPERRELTHKELVSVGIREIVKEIVVYSHWLEKRTYYMELHNAHGFKIGEVSPFVGELDWQQHIDDLTRRYATYTRQKII